MAPPKPLYFVLGLGCACVVSVLGCQTMRRPVEDLGIDQELATPSAPASVPSEPVRHEPRPGFEQEPAVSQTP